MTDIMLPPWSAATAGVWAKQMGAVASDPREGDAWTHCTACSRPTRMTGTKLCDRCWERRRYRLPNVIELRLFTLEEREPENLELVLCWGADDPQSFLGEWHAAAFEPWWPERGFFEPDLEGYRAAKVDVAFWAPLPTREGGER